jgi:hypothetical protein
VEAASNIPRSSIHLSLRRVGFTGTAPYDGFSQSIKAEQGQAGLRSHHGHQIVLTSGRISIRGDFNFNQPSLTTPYGFCPGISGSQLKSWAHKVAPSFTFLRLDPGCRLKPKTMMVREISQGRIRKGVQLPSMKQPSKDHFPYCSTIFLRSTSVLSPPRSVYEVDR